MFRTEPPWISGRRTTEGKGFAFTEILTRWKNIRDRLTIVTNLAHPAAGGVGSDAGADHARSAAVFLSGVHPEQRFDPRGCHHRSDRRAEYRPGHALAFPRAVDRRGGVELRLWLRLRILQHDFLEDADHAAADGEQSAGGVRESCSAMAARNADRFARKQQSRSLLDSVMGQVASLAEPIFPPPTGPS